MAQRTNCLDVIAASPQQTLYLEGGKVEQKSPSAAFAQVKGQGSEFSDLLMGSA